MKTVANKYSEVMNHGFNSAVIIDNQAEQVGSVLVRYTKGEYGHNPETQLIFKDGEDFHNVSKKAACYDRSTLFYILEEIGAKCYNHQGDQYHGRPQQTGPGVSIHGISRESYLTSFKIGNKKYRVLWVQS